MNREKIIERVRKLLALSNSSNEHEAALAAAHAQRLLAQHNLAMSELEVKEEGAGEVELIVAKVVPKWILFLFSIVTNAFDCSPVITTSESGSRLRFIGVGEDPAVAVCTFQYLMKELRRLASLYLRFLETSKGKITRPSDRSRIRNSYLLGGIQGVKHSMSAQKAKTPTTSLALVPVKNALVEQYMEQNFSELRTRQTRKSSIITSAFNQGRHDGLHISTGTVKKELEQTWN